jgi:predicted nuclease with TOPRIM domain
MNKKILIVLLAALLLLSFALTGCQSGGVAQESYDELKALYDDIASKLTDAADEASDLESVKSEMEAKLQEAQEEISQLQDELDALVDQYVLEGDTTAETVEKIVQYYHDTHVYSTWDLFVCTDMASEVWNILKAQGINSLMVVGNIDVAVTDILGSNHAWVLAEVAPGEYLALETTGGRVVYESENSLYYRGWYFTSPADQKHYQKLVREYNTMVAVRNDIAERVNEAVEYYNESSNQAEADQRMAVYEELMEIQESMEAELVLIQTKIDSLAIKLQ